MTFLGKHLDSETISIAESTITEIRVNLRKKRLQIIIGKLSYIVDCIRPVPLFFCFVFFYRLPDLRIKLCAGKVIILFKSGGKERYFVVLDIYGHFQS